jgi:hypothetical protein
MGRATQIVKGVSHIQITLSDVAPAKRPARRAKQKEALRAAAAGKPAKTTTTTAKAE